MVKGVQEVLDAADYQFSNKFMIAAKLLIRVLRLHIKTESPRLKEYWDLNSALLEDGA